MVACKFSSPLNVGLGARGVCQVITSTHVFISHHILFPAGLSRSGSLDILESAKSCSASRLGLVGGHHAGASLAPVVVGEGGEGAFRVQGALLLVVVGRQGLGSKLRGKSQGVDKDPKGGEEDVGGVERVVRCKGLILGRLEHQGKGRGGYGG